MKMNEILSEMDAVLQIEKDDEKQTTLVDPKTKIDLTTSYYKTVRFY